MSPWIRLWELATAEGPATIEVDDDSPDYVVLIYSNGSRGGWYWHDGDWRPQEQLDTCPCDVGARDRL